MVIGVGQRQDLSTMVPEAKPRREAKQAPRLAYEGVKVTGMQAKSESKGVLAGHPLGALRPPEH